MTTRIAIAGDWHGVTWWARDCINSVPDDVRLMIHLGDFGLMGKGFPTYVHKVNQAAAARDIDLWVIPGNHENHDWIGQQEARDDGVILISDRISLLPRGFRFDIEGVSFCAVGGAVSVDQGRRTIGRTWWPQEEISEQEVAAAAGEGLRTCC